MRAYKRLIFRFVAGSPEHVVSHARWQQSRGRRPSSPLFCNGTIITNPARALSMALEMLSTVQHSAPPEIELDAIVQDMCTIAQRDMCKVIYQVESITIVVTPLSTINGVLQEFHDSLFGQ